MSRRVISAGHPTVAQAQQWADTIRRDDKWSDVRVEMGRTRQEHIVTGVFRETTQAASQTPRA